jgi:hypothetical protein
MLASALYVDEVAYEEAFVEEPLKHVRHEVTLLTSM